MRLRAESSNATVIPDNPPDSTNYQFPPESRRSHYSRRERKHGEAGIGYVVSRDVQLHAADGTVLGTIVRLNAQTIWFDPLEDANTPYSQTVAVHVASPLGKIGPFSAKIGIEPVDDELYAVARMDELSLADGQILIGFMLDATERGIARPAPSKSSVLTEIEDKDRIRAIAIGLAKRSAQGFLRNGEIFAPATITSYDAVSDTMTWELSEGTAAEPFTTTDLCVEVPGYNSVYQLTFDAARGDAGRVITGTPVSAKYMRQRRYRRTALSTSGFARFEHPLWSEISTFSCPLLDVSFGGIAFVADPRRDALYVGLRIKNIEVFYGRGQVMLFDGIVRTIVSSPNGLSTCGLSVEAQSPHDASAWADFVMRSLNQTTAPGDDKVEQLWDLYKDSGYFNLSGKGPEEFDILARAFRHVVEQSRSSPWLTYQSVWPTRYGIEASISMLRAHSGTWLMHQVAKRKGASHRNGEVRHVLRDTYLRAYEYAQADANCNWVASYVEAQVSWTKRSHFAFAQQFGLTGGVVAWPFQFMEISCTDRPEVTPIRLFRVGPANAEECELLCTVLRQTRPEAYLEPLDLVPERLAFTECKRAWKAANFERDREILVARRRDASPVAAAIVEIGETGTNLFRLCDSLRLVALEPGGEAAFMDLIEKVRAWFRARSKESFVYFSECDDTQHIQAAMARDLGPGRFWAIRRELIPDFLELVCELSAQRLGGSAGDSNIFTAL